jgi:hypothetical protein
MRPGCRAVCSYKGSIVPLSLAMLRATPVRLLPGSTRAQTTYVPAAGDLLEIHYLTVD